MKYPKPIGRVLHSERLAYIALLPCIARGLGDPCKGPIEVAHVGRVFDPDQRALGRKADDDTCIPLCRWHHLTHGGGIGGKGPPFRAMTDECFTRWTWDAVEKVRAAYEQGREPEAVCW